MIAPSTLPALETEPALWPIARRARLVMESGAGTLKGGDLLSARAQLTEAITLDPSLAAGRVHLARVYARAGSNETIVRLLLPMAKAGDLCGDCIVSLLGAKEHPDLRAFWATEDGAKIAKLMPEAGIDFAKWANELSDVLQSGMMQRIPDFIHPQVSFELVRSCPQCDNAEKRLAERREFRGYPLALKVAGRFNTHDTRYNGRRLRSSGQPSCRDGCCSWSPPVRIPASEAALETLCFRALTRQHAALTRIQVAYGPTREEQRYVPPAPAPTTAPAPATGTAK